MPEEEAETKQINLDPDDQPMWESAKTVAPTPNSAIVQIDVDDNFVINKHTSKCHGHGLAKGEIIQIFYHGLDESTQGILDIIAGGIFLYKTPNQAFKFLEDKVLFKLDWSNKLQMKPTQKSVTFADGSDSNNDNSRLMEKLEALTIKMDSQF
ncbi:hypothetical protein Tco_0917536 [Tanacetum coccineum]